MHSRTIRPEARGLAADSQSVRARPFAARMKLAILAAGLAAALAAPAPGAPPAPATYTVNTTVDLPLGDPGLPPTSTTLRAAIMKANANAPAKDTIVLQPGATYTLTRTPADSAPGALAAGSGDLDITDDVDITGNGATINGGGIDRVFQIEGTPQRAIGVIMQKLKIRNGVCAPAASPGMGGGIYARATNLTLTSCTLVNNTAQNDGGGIAIVGRIGNPVTTTLPATLTLNNCTVSSNTGAQGGGIAAILAQVTVNGGAITWNRALAGSGSPGDGGYQGGGAILGVGDATRITIGNDCQITSNSASANGGGLALFTGQASATRVVLAGNRANFSGGGVFNSDVSSGSVTLAGADLSGNTADADKNGSGGGGALFSGGGPVALQFCRLFNNTATQGSALCAAGPGAIKAENCWWGSNGSPAAVLAGAVDADPWLKLTLTAAPPVINAGTSSTLTARLTRNSSGIDTATSGTLRDGIPVVFSSALGTVAGAPAALTGGVARARFDAGGAPGLNAAAVTVDGVTTRALEIVLLQASLTPQPPGVLLAGSQTTLTATVTRNGSPVAGQPVAFLVASGPDAGKGAAGVTGATGQAVFSYVGQGAGTDTIRVTGTHAYGGQNIPLAGRAQIDWAIKYGTVSIQVQPQGAAWTLQGPLGYAQSGGGGASFNNVPAGPVTVTWKAPTGYDPPAPTVQTLTLAPGGAVSFLQVFVPSLSGAARQRAQIIRYLLGLSSNAAGLDLNGDGVVDVADLVKSVLTQP